MFLYGFRTAYDRVFPYEFVAGAVKAASLVLGRNQDLSNPYPDTVYADTSSRKKFSNRNELDSGLHDVVVLNYFHKEELCLIDNSGRCLHKYKIKLDPSDHKKIFRRFGELSGYLDSGQHLYIQDIHIFPNGDALMMLNVAGKVWSIGAGIIKVDRDSNILWQTFAEGTHHKFDVGEDGTIYALQLERKPAPPKKLAHLQAPFIDQYLLVLDPDGKVMERINLFEAIDKSDYKYYLYFGNLVPMKHNWSANDYLHVNDVEVITKEKAKAFRYGNEGDLLISMRDLHAVGVLDMKEKKFTWIKRGPWVAQHDPDLLPNGNLMIFDNLGGGLEDGISRVIEYNPVTDQVVWKYSGSREEPFFSVRRGSAFALANGNVMISETMGGRVFEVNRAGKIIWQFVSPYRFGDKKQYVPAVRWPSRINLGAFTPEFRTYLTDAAKTAKPVGAEQTAAR